MIKIKFLTYESVKQDTKRVFRALQSDSIVLIDAKLTPGEEADLIKDTMERLDEKFSGIELSSLDPVDSTGIARLRGALAEALTGKKRGFTIIGPASLVRKIKKNPQELLVYM